jgi:hypothetical protein
MDISCAFPPVPDTPEHIALAEWLGYRRAWVYAAALRARMDQLAGRGVTEVAFQPAGPDIPRELTAFAGMAGLAAHRPHEPT